MKLKKVKKELLDKYNENKEKCEKNVEYKKIMDAFRISLLNEKQKNRYIKENKEEDMRIMNKLM